jgi:hypothetical protein
MVDIVITRFCHQLTLFVFLRALSMFLWWLVVVAALATTETALVAVVLVV